MNDLLQEFMVEAGFARRFIHPANPDGKHISVDPETKKKAQKFSELIINECKKFVDEKSSEKLTKHFGVK